jgi:hypothetical protein
MNNPFEIAPEHALHVVGFAPGDRTAARHPFEETVVVQRHQRDSESIECLDDGRVVDGQIAEDVLQPRGELGRALAAEQVDDLVGCILAVGGARRIDQSSEPGGISVGDAGMQALEKIDAGREEARPARPWIATSRGQRDAGAHERDHAAARELPFKFVVSCRQAPPRRATLTGPARG